jgi:hypothetical protein
MKKVYLILSIIWISVLCNIFAHQPLEQGLLFGPDPAAKKMDLAQRVSPVVPQQIAVAKEKRGDGSDSSVFKVNGMTQFLHMATKSQKPLVIKIFSDRSENYIIYQDIADKLQDFAVFISLEANSNSPLVQLFLLMLRFGGLDLSAQEVAFPLFIYCKKDFVLLQNGLVNFKKDALKLLVAPGFVDKDRLQSAIESEAGNDVEIVGLDSIDMMQEVPTEQEEMPKTKDKSVIEKIKNWFKSKF